MTATQSDIDRILAHAAMLVEREAGFGAASQALADGLGIGWEWVTAWAVPPEKGGLIAKAIWHAPCLPGAESRDFQDFTLRWRPTPGEGKLGTAWASGEWQSSTDLSRDIVLPRSIFAARAGFKKALWVPVHAGGSVCGVLEFFRA